jgi:hypothetical protein
MPTMNISTSWEEEEHKRKLWSAFEVIHKLDSKMIQSF